MQTLDIQREETGMRCMGPKLAGLQPWHRTDQNTFIGRQSPGSSIPTLVVVVGGGTLEFGRNG